MIDYTPTVAETEIAEKLAHATLLETLNNVGLVATNTAEAGAYQKQTVEALLSYGFPESAVRSFNAEVTVGDESLDFRFIYGPGTSPMISVISGENNYYVPRKTVCVRMTDLAERGEVVYHVVAEQNFGDEPAPPKKSGFFGRLFGK